MAELNPPRPGTGARGGVCRTSAGCVRPGGGFPITDLRHDALVGAVLTALHELQARCGPPPPSTAVIAVTATGCTSHIARVVEAAADGLKARQAFFARASATMLATYPALALSTHGPTFALTGGADTLRWALTIATALVRNGHCEAAILLGADALDEPARVHAAALWVDATSPTLATAWGDGPHLDADLPSAVLAAWLGNKGEAVPAVYLSEGTQA
jgi:hypothetical protein